MIPLSKIVIKNSEINSVIKVLKSGQLSQGKKVRELEKKFAKLCGVKYAIAVVNGTAALHCALHAIGIRSGDEIITTPFTFVATANSILMIGAKPIFVDIDENTYNLDPDKIESALTPKTKAIIAVNLYGQPADYEKINKIAEKNKLFVIEDAAQSINAKYKNKMSGNLADIGCFSFYATKNIMSGEGGMVTTNNKNYSEKIRMFRQHGEKPEKKYAYFGLGYNYRMTDILASLALEQLKYVNKITKTRQKIAKLYDHSLGRLKNIKIPVQQKNLTHVYHQYTLRINSRNRLKKYLEKKGIQTNIYYPVPLYNFKHLSSVNISNNFPVTEKVTRGVLSIPINANITIKDIRYIIESIKSYV